LSTMNPQGTSPLSLSATPITTRHLLADWQDSSSA
jgi:hypothetical protein